MVALACLMGGKPDASHPPLGADVRDRSCRFTCSTRLKVSIDTRRTAHNNIHLVKVRSHMLHCFNAMVPGCRDVSMGWRVIGGPFEDRRPQRRCLGCQEIADCGGKQDHDSTYPL